jgi:hypothetical protein
MYKIRINICRFMLLVAIMVFFPAWLVTAEEKFPSPLTYMPSFVTFNKAKKKFDDPRSPLASLPFEKVLPKVIYDRLIFNEKEMANAWESIVGFKSPDVVGKIAPEIKPGHYTYQDMSGKPGLRALMWPEMAKRIKPGGPPFAGDFSKFEVVPTQQRFWAMPIAEATRDNAGKTMMDSNGYIKPETWISGYPFPRPSGKFKAQQVVYNFRYSYANFEMDNLMAIKTMGFDRNLKLDMDMDVYYNTIRLAGRTLAPPFGFLDERAKQRLELTAAMIDIRAPRDIAGVVEITQYYQSPDQVDQSLMYVPSLRRVRKMSATDTQDPILGQDIIYDDSNGFSQKITPKRYPMKFKITEEREYLVPVSTDMTEYLSSTTHEMCNVKMERRPMYVVELTELDTNYVYSRRVLYIDQETFQLYHSEMYDKKGRLYRSITYPYRFFPKMGMITYAYSWMRDHIDLHSGIQYQYTLPAFWIRSEIGLKSLSTSK